MMGELGEGTDLEDKELFDVGTAASSAFSISITRRIYGNQVRVVQNLFKKIVHARLCIEWKRAQCHNTALDSFCTEAKDSKDGQHHLPS